MVCCKPDAPGLCVEWSRRLNGWVEKQPRCRIVVRQIGGAYGYFRVGLFSKRIKDARGRWTTLMVEQDLRVVRRDQLLLIR